MMLLKRCPRMHIARFLIVLMGVVALSGCVVAPGGGYGYGYRVHPIVRPIWHPGWRRGWRR